MPKVTGKRTNAYLREERLRRQWSQQELADHLGTTPNTISRWELGITSPSPYFSAKLSTLFGKTVRELGVLAEQREPGNEPASQDPQDSISASDVAAPSLWNVPHRRNPYFTGREGVLQQLYEALHSGAVAALTQVQAISGLGGVGKTQTAVEYAYRFRKEYRAVLWVRADSRETLLLDLVALADTLGLPQKAEQDSTQALAAVRRWLQEQANWLLILDDIEEDLTTMSEFLPVLHEGHILLTSKGPVTGTLARGIDLEPLGLEEGALLILRRAGYVAPNALLKDVPPKDRECAVEIARIMDSLPLALDQAGAYLEETDCSLSGYLEHYRTGRAALLGLRGGNPLTDHPASVAMSFSLALEQVERSLPAAADLLRFCAFLHPDAIPEEIITDGVCELGLVLQPMASDPLALDAAVKVLRRFSLLRRNHDNRTLTMHRLVQAVVRDTIPEEAQRPWAERVVQAVNSVFPNAQGMQSLGIDLKDRQSLGVTSLCQRYLPQVYACAKVVEQWSMKFPEAGRLLNEAGLYCLDLGQYTQAEALLELALDIWQKTFGEMHPQVAETLNRLALLHQQCGRYAKAEPLYQQALTILEHLLGPTHPDVAFSLQCLATCYHYQGKYAQVTPLYQRALAIWEQAVGPFHPDVASNLNGLARLYREQGRKAEAEELYQRALELFEQVQGATHPNVAICLTNLGLLYSDQGREIEAEELHQRALHILERALGPDDPFVALSLNHLALLFGRRRRFAQASAFGQRALAIREQVYGSEHPLVAESLATLGILSAQKGKYAQGSILFERALTILEQAGGTTHPLIAQCLYDWAELLVHQGRYSHAEPFYRRSLAIWEQALGRDHTKVARCMERYTDFKRRLMHTRTTAVTDTEVLLLRTHPELAAAHKEGTGTTTQHEGSLENFFSARCEFHPQEQSPASDLWNAYQHWVLQHGIRIPLSRQTFSQHLYARGCCPARTNSRRYWRGVALKGEPAE